MPAVQAKPRYVLIRVLLVWASAFPVFYGAAGLTSPGTIAKVTGALSAGVVTVSPEVGYLLKPLALYILMCGCLLLFAALDPPRYRAIVLWGALLLFLRGLQRLSLTEELNRVFQIPVPINLFHGAYLLVLASALALCCPGKKAPPPGHSPQA